jgi:hypothetical protein
MILSLSIKIVIFITSVQIRTVDRKLLIMYIDKLSANDEKY